MFLFVGGISFLLSLLGRRVPVEADGEGRFVHVSHKSINELIANINTNERLTCKHKRRLWEIDVKSAAYKSLSELSCMIMGPPGSMVVLNSKMNVPRTENVKYDKHCVVFYCIEQIVMRQVTKNRDDFEKI
jgi:hypothetical protein